MPVKKLFDVGQREVIFFRSRGKIEKSFSPKLTDYFIQGVRKDNLCLREENLFYHINIRFYFYTSV
jgi:hypothetical protein